MSDKKNHINSAGDGYFHSQNTNWPTVHNLSGVDMLLIAGRMLDQNQISVPASDPVDVAINWLERQIDSFKEEPKKVATDSFPKLVPPTLPLRMQGKVGVIEYEIIDRENQKRLRKLRKEREQRKMRKRESRKSTGAESLKRKLEENPPEIPRPKRVKIPNSLYDSDTYMCSSPKLQRTQ